MKISWAFLIVFVGAFAAGCGCGGGADDGVKAQDRQTVEDAHSIATRVDGNYDKLTPDEKQQILKLANNNEASARQMLNLMAHPPNAHPPGPKGYQK